MPFPATAIPAAAFCGILLLVTLKHFAADFVLQTGWMARGKERVEGWAPALAAHGAVHALGTLAIALAVRPSLWWLAVVDFVVHGAIDRGKALVALRGRWAVTDDKFWWLVGFDQFLHQVTNIGLVAALLML